MRRILAPLLVLALWVVFAPPVFADSLGQVESFFVNPSYDRDGASNETATLRAIGQHGYFYIDNRYWAGLTAAQQNQFTTNLNTLSSQFDTAIYPRETSFFGSENNPGVDGDSHVVLLMEEMTPGSGGYFETINSYSKARAPDSNAREMVSINVDSVLTSLGKNYLAHEFQHLISFNQKELLRDASEDVWLNEGRSEYAITLSGYSSPYQGSGLQRRAQTYVNTPSDSLVDWPNTSLDYGITSVFLHYLADRYGAAIISSTEHTASAGVAAIDEWLASNGRSERFGNVFSDFMAASYLNNRSIDPKFGFMTDGLNGIHIVPPVTAVLDHSHQRSEYSSSLKEWQPLWIQNNISAVGSGGVNVHIAGSSDVGWYGSVIARYSNGSVLVAPFVSQAGKADISVADQSNGSAIMNTVVAVSQGSGLPVDDRVIVSKPLTVTLTLGEVTGPVATPQPPVNENQIPINGDLIRHGGQPEIYVVWGPYRRYLPDGVLALYGFQNRPVQNVSEEVFNRYQTSNYVREEGQKKVYALWPDLTKHWMNITAAQWDASARDWGAIFTVNSSEVSFYATGPDITH